MRNERNFGDNMKVIFGAGGTAGHMYMASGIAKHLKDSILITDERGQKYIDKNLFSEVHVLPIRSVDLREMGKMFASYRQCLDIFKQNKSAVYFGCGAYTSLVAGIAAVQSGNHIHLYQGDQIPGLANKLLQYCAKKCWVSSENINLRKKSVVGCIARLDNQKLRNDGPFRILVVGSSIGTDLVSETLPNALNQLPLSLRERIEVWQQNRNPEQCATSYDEIKSVHVAEFLDVPTLLPQTHLVIGRAGWSLLSDLIAVQRAAIIMPWMGAKDNHQYHNAMWLDPNGFWRADEHDSDALAEKISLLAQDMFAKNDGEEYVVNGIIADRMRDMSAVGCDAGKIIADYLLQL